LNKNVSKEEYLKTYNNIKTDIYFRNKLISDYENLKVNSPSKNLKIINSENIINSDKIENSQ